MDVNQSIFMKLKSVSCKLYNRGLMLARDGNLSSAAKTLSIAIQLNKENVESRNLLGLVLLEMGELAEAVKHWTISVRIQKENNKAVSYLEHINQQVSLVQQYNEAVKLYNDSLSCIHQKNEDLAIIKLKKAVHKNAKFLQAHNLMALAYIKAEDLENAEKCVREVLKRDPNNATAVRYLKHLSKDRDSGNKSAQFSKLNPAKENNMHLSGYFRSFAQPASVFFTGVFVTILVFFFLVIPSWGQKNFAQMNSQILQQKEEIKNLQEQEKAKQSEAEVLKKKLQALEEEKEEYSSMQLQVSLAQQLKDASRLVEQKQYTEAQNVSVLIQKNEKHLTYEQSQLFKKLKEEINQNIFTYQIAEGKRVFGMGKYDQAAGILEKVLQAQPDHPNRPQGLYYLGKSFFKMKQYEEAKKAFNEILQKYPDSIYVKYTKGWLSQIPQ